MFPVISRCQEALKFLSNEKQFSGRLCVYAERAVPESRKWSVLRPPPTLPYTTSKMVNENSFTHVLNRLFRFVGVDKSLPLDENDLELAKDGGEDLVAPPAPTITPQKQPHPRQQQQQVKKLPNVQPLKTVSMLGTKFLMKMVQTDPVKCEACQLRNSIKHETVGVQCGESSSVSVGTQVCEEDISPKKKQSLAALTPAQLLGKSANEVRSEQNTSKFQKQQQRANKEKDIGTSRNNFERNRFEMYHGPSRGYSPSRQLRFSPPRQPNSQFSQPLFPTQMDFYDEPPEAPFEPPFRNPNFPNSGRYGGYRY